MSTGGGATRGAGLHRGELRLRLEAAFSAAQMRDLAARWGLEPAAGWDRSAADAAHGLLREAERRFGLQELVRRLKAERPLVEWPDIDDAALAEWGPPSRRMAEANAAGAGELALGEATLVDMRAAPGETVPGEPLESAPAGAETAAPSPASKPAPPPSSAPPASAFAPFPGTVVPPPKREGLDPRLLYGVAGAMLVVTGVAFAAGMLLSERTRASSSAPAAAASEHPSPANMASRIFVDALDHVADGCDVEVDGPATKDILAFVQRECGPASGHTKRVNADRTGDSTDDHPYRTKKRRPDPDTADTDTPPPPPPRRPARSGCITSCASEHASCTSACGPEPGDANQYDAWQSCTSKCLAAESRCRLGCR